MAVSLIGGLQLIGMGFVGEYVGRIHEETKNRPLYIIKALHGIESEGILKNEYDESTQNQILNPPIFMVR